MLNKTLYSKKYNVEFFHITKNAMTAIIRDLNMSWKERETLPVDRKIFCVIRDPLKRVLSGFNEIKKLYNINVREHTFRKIDPKTESLIFRNTNLVDSFENYIREMEKNGFFDSHNQPQYDFLEGYTVKDLFDVPRKIKDIEYFLKFESLDDEISKLVGEDIKIKRINSGNENIKSTIKPFLENYKQRVDILYQKDYILYRNNLK